VERLSPAAGKGLLEVPKQDIPGIGLQTVYGMARSPTGEPGLKYGTRCRKPTSAARSLQFTNFVATASRLKFESYYVSPEY
jgi:hypothetical protein